jgi:hypothetical protein
MTISTQQPTPGATDRRAMPASAGTQPINPGTKANTMNTTTNPSNPHGAPAGPAARIAVCDAAGRRHAGRQPDPAQPGVDRARA